MTKSNKKPQIYMKDRAAWRKWLQENHQQVSGIWLVFDKKSETLTYDDIVEEALCFGWIDSTQKILNETQGMFYIAPRRKGGIWAKSNKARIEKLIESGEMTEAGLKVIENARTTGDWDAYNAVENLEIPEDFQQALELNPVAARHFAAFPPSSKKQILWWIISAKKPETRLRRIVETVSFAAQNIRSQ